MLLRKIEMPCFACFHLELLDCFCVQVWNATRFQFWPDKCGSIIQGLRTAFCFAYNGTVSIHNVSPATPKLVCEVDFQPNLVMFFRDGCQVWNNLLSTLSFEPCFMVKENQNQTTLGRFSTAKTNFTESPLHWFQNHQKHTVHNENNLLSSIDSVAWHAVSGHFYVWSSDSCHSSE